MCFLTSWCTFVYVQSYTLCDGRCNLIFYGILTQEVRVLEECYYNIKWSILVSPNIQNVELGIFSTSWCVLIQVGILRK